MSLKIQPAKPEIITNLYYKVNQISSINIKNLKNELITKKSNLNY